MGVKTPTGKDKWHGTTVNRILQNGKYKGDILLQKGYTVDFFTKKKKKNNGELQQYYVEGDREAIIDPATFDMVQAEFERRNNGGNGECRYSGVGGVLFKDQMRMLRRLVRSKSMALQQQVQEDHVSLQ